MTSKAPRDQLMHVAENIMFEDREILRASAAADREQQMPIARKVMERRREALKKLAE